MIRHQTIQSQTWALFLRLSKRLLIIVIGLVILMPPHTSPPVCISTSPPNHVCCHLYLEWHVQYRNIVDLGHTGAIMLLNMSATDDTLNHDRTWSFNESFWRTGWNTILTDFWNDQSDDIMLRWTFNMWQSLVQNGLSSMLRTRTACSRNINSVATHCTGDYVFSMTKS